MDWRWRDIAELGCGYRTFTLPVARRISGIIETPYIKPAMVERTRQRAAQAALQKVHCHVRDVMQHGFSCLAGSQDACLLFNILHCEEPVRLLTEAARIVRSGSMVLAVRWRYDT